MLSKQRSREVRRSIRQVLLAHWDPIGIRDEPNAQDEYEAYEGKIAGLLTDGSSDDDIAAYLQWVEVDRMGMGAEALNRFRPVVAALRAINVCP
jgi:hypothetical protein